MAPGAPESYCQAVLSLLDVARNEPFQKLGGSVDKFLGDFVLEDILGNLFVVARKLFKAGHIVRVWYEPHIHSPVGFKGYSVFVAEGHDVEDEGILPAVFQK